MPALMGYLQKISKGPFFYALLLAIAVQAGISSYWYDNGKPSFYKYIPMGLGILELLLSAVLLREARSYLKIGSMEKERAIGILISAFIRLLGPFILINVVSLVVKDSLHGAGDLELKILNSILRLVMMAVWVPLGISLAIYRADAAGINLQSLNILKQNFKALLPTFTISLLFLFYPVVVSVFAGPASFILSNGLLYILFSLISGAISFVIIPYLYLLKITEILQARIRASEQAEPAF